MGFHIDLNLYQHHSINIIIEYLDYVYNYDLVDNYFKIILADQLYLLLTYPVYITTQSERCLRKK
jgi:hypothetical protein